MHVRKPHKRKSSISFRYGSPKRRNLILNYTSTYKYLRVVLDEHIKKKKTQIAHPEFQDHSLQDSTLITAWGSKRSKCHDACITNVCDSAQESGVWAQTQIQRKYNRSLESFLGVHKCCSIWGSGASRRRRSGERQKSCVKYSRLNIQETKLVHVTFSISLN